jgi:hypothetical protein
MKFIKFYFLKKNYNKKIIMSTQNNLIIITGSVKQHGYIYIYKDSICLFAFKGTPKVPTSNKHVMTIGTNRFLFLFLVLFGRIYFTFW